MSAGSHQSLFPRELSQGHAPNPRRWNSINPWQSQSHIINDRCIRVWYQTSNKGRNEIHIPGWYPPKVYHTGIKVHPYYHCLFYPYLSCLYPHLWSPSGTAIENGWNPKFCWKSQKMSDIKCSQFWGEICILRYIMIHPQFLGWTMAGEIASRRHPSASQLT